MGAANSSARRCSTAPWCSCLGSFIIGLVAGSEGFQPIAPVFEDGVPGGVLCLFLLDMGRRQLKPRAGRSLMRMCTR